MSFVTALQRNLAPIPLRPLPPSSSSQAEVEAATSAEKSAEGRKSVKAARQFETQLLTSLLAGLQRAMGSMPGSEEAGENAQYQSMATQSLASAWTAAGGIGLSHMLTEALSHASETKGTTPQAPGPPTTLPSPTLPSSLGPPRSSFP